MDRDKITIPEEVKEQREEDEQEEQEELRQQGFYTQEAFTPIFQVAPEEVPQEAQVHVPTEEEKKITLENMYKKLGVKAKEFIESPVLEITPEKEKLINRSSIMAARIFSAVMMWGFSVFGWEYGQVAPTVDHSQRMLEPIFRIIARHSEFVGTISPDADDVVECATAMSDYALYAMAMMQHIREDKAANNGRYTGTSNHRVNEGQTRYNSNAPRSNDLRGPTSASQEPTQNARIREHPYSEEHLTTDQQYNRDMLRQLSIRDFETRSRRQGRI
jgi:hypothetical protein